MNLTERQLRMFTTVARLAHISRASEALHISQPALTRALREFEQRLGVPLFERSTRRVAMTTEGARFLPVAQRLLADMEAALRELREQTQGLAGTVDLAVGSAFGCAVLPAALGLLAASHPQVRVRVIDDNSGGITGRVARSEVEMGIGSPVGEAAGLQFEPLLSAPLGVLGDARRWQLAQSLGLRHLAKLPLLKEPSDSSIAHLLRAHGSELIEAMERGTQVSSLALQLALAHAGIGVAVLSALGASHPQAAGLRFVPLRPALRREIFLMRRRDRPLSPAACALAEAIRQALPQVRLHPSVRLSAEGIQSPRRR
jgi:LysR family transcriptional regulator, carnitine catabolism transcriptional activator